VRTSPFLPLIDRRLIKPHGLDTQFLADLCSLEATSDECPSKVRALLDCPLKTAAARGLQGTEAQKLVDFLDRVSIQTVGSRATMRALNFNQVLSQSHLDNKYRHRSLLLLTKICKTRTIVPSSYILNEDSIRVGRVYYHGGFAEVSIGEYMGCPVAIKYLKINEEEADRTFKVPQIDTTPALSLLNTS